MNWRAALASGLTGLGGLGGLASSAALAVDGVSIEAGRGNDRVNMARIGAQWNWKQTWKLDNNWQLGGYTDASIGTWHANTRAPGQNASLIDIGLTPTLRLSRSSGSGPFAEIGLGTHLISHTAITSRTFSTAVQFGTHLGAGYRFGNKQAFELGLRVQHLSNAAIKRPNGGINFAQLRLQYHF
jgi:lipid A 3-O-deacylase